MRARVLSPNILHHTLVRLVGHRAPPSPGFASRIPGMSISVCVLWVTCRVKNVQFIAWLGNCITQRLVFESSLRLAAAAPLRHTLWSSGGGLPNDVFNPPARRRASPARLASSEAECGSEPWPGGTARPLPWLARRVPVTGGGPPDHRTGSHERARLDSPATRSTAGRHPMRCALEVERNRMSSGKLPALVTREDDDSNLPQRESRGASPPRPARSVPRAGGPTLAPVRPPAPGQQRVPQHQTALERGLPTQRQQAGQAGVPPLQEPQQMPPRAEPPPNLMAPNLTHYVHHVRTSDHAAFIPAAARA